MVLCKHFTVKVVLPNKHYCRACVNSDASALPLARNFQLRRKITVKPRRICINDNTVVERASSLCYKKPTIQISVMPNAVGTNRRLLVLPISWCKRSGLTTYLLVTLYSSCANTESSGEWEFENVSGTIRNIIALRGSVWNTNRGAWQPVHTTLTSPCLCCRVDSSRWIQKYN